MHWNGSPCHLSYLLVKRNPNPMRYNILFAFESVKQILLCSSAYHLNSSPTIVNVFYYFPYAPLSFSIELHQFSYLKVKVNTMHPIWNPLNNWTAHIRKRFKWCVCIWMKLNKNPFRSLSIMLCQFQFKWIWEDAFGWFINIYCYIRYLVHGKHFEQCSFFEWLQSLVSWNIFFFQSFLPMFFSSSQLLYLSHCFNQSNENFILLWLRLIHIWDGIEWNLLIFFIHAPKKKIKIKFGINDLNCSIFFNACPGFRNN